jgi:hypothetical protein
LMIGAMFTLEVAWILFLVYAFVRLLLPGSRQADVREVVRLDFCRRRHQPRRPAQARIRLGPLSTNHGSRDQFHFTKYLGQSLIFWTTPDAALRRSKIAAHVEGQYDSNPSRVCRTTPRPMGPIRGSCGTDCCDSASRFRCRSGRPMDHLRKHCSTDDCNAV